MELNTAITLLAKGVLPEGQPQSWYDLGAGTGVFTQALAALLPSESDVLAIDRDISSLNQIPVSLKSVRISTRVADFTLPMPDEQRDGILLANSLHFIKDAVAFLAILKNRLKTGGRLLIVEYDLTQSSRWVPYPVSFSSLQVLCQEAGLEPPSILAKTPSRLNRSHIYSALVNKNI